MKKAYVIQDAPEEKQIYSDPHSTKNIPQTVLIRDSSALRNNTRNTLFEQSSSKFLVDKRKGDTYYWAIKGIPANTVVEGADPHFSLNGKKTGLEIPKEVVQASGITEGDEVNIIIDDENHHIVIDSVNGERDAAKVNSWKDINKLTPDYPIKPLAIEKVKIPTKTDKDGQLVKDLYEKPVEDYDFDIRVATSITPIGMGQGYWLVAPGNSGKTYLLAKYAMALSKMTNDNPNLHLIIGYIGDRPVDYRLYEDAIKLADNRRVEIHQCPWTDDPSCQVSMARFVVNRARRLAATRDVVLLIDSASRIVSMHTASEEMENHQGGMIRGGIYRKSIFEIIAQLFGTYGYFAETGTSLTIIASLLNDEKSTEGVVAQETKENTPNAVLQLVTNATLEFPRIAITNTMSSTRFPFGKDFRSIEQRKEMDEMEKRRWDGGYTKAEEAHKRTLDYFRKNPEPKY
jgi:transcription termination factor Rho